MKKNSKYIMHGLTPFFRILIVFISIIFLFFTSVSSLTLKKKCAGTDLYSIDCLEFYPGSYFSIKVSKDSLTYGYLCDVGSNVVSAPHALYGEQLQNESKDLLFAFNKKGEANCDFVDYTSYNKKCTRIVNGYRPVIIRVYDYNTGRLTYLYDEIGNLLGHYGRTIKTEYPSECYNGIPKRWLRIMDIIAIVRNDVSQKMSKRNDESIEMINMKFREFYRKPDTKIIEGAVDAKFLSFVYSNNKIDGVAFADIAKLLEKRKLIKKEVMPIINMQQGNAVNVSDETDKYTGFEEIEKLVGLPKD